MDHPHRGRCQAIPPASKMVLEMLHHGHKVPALPLAKVMHVGPLVEARKAGAAVSWIAIFMKGYGLVAERHPDLRRAYMPFPWPHLYEHPTSVCALLIERDHEEETIVLGSKVRWPELQALAAIDGQLEDLRNAPVPDVGDFRRWLRCGRLPGVLRRLLIGSRLNLSGSQRARRMGTFAISSLGKLGVEQHHAVSPLTTHLTFGPISLAGEVCVRIIYDHRVMDGRCVARCLNDLEEVLNTRILDELKSMSDARSPGDLASRRSPFLTC